LFLSVINNKRTIHSLKHKKLTFYKINNDNIGRELAVSVRDASFEDFTNFVTERIKGNTTLINLKEKFFKPFMDRTIFNYIVIRENYRNLKTKYHGNHTILQLYKFYRNKVTSLIRDKKRKINEKILNENINNKRKTWKHLNNILYNRDQAPKDSISSISNGNYIITNRYEIP
jgi:hypothetical protein